MEKATQVAPTEQPNGDAIKYILNLTSEQEERPTVVVDLPVLPVRNTVLFPNITISLLVTHEQSLRAIEAAMDKDQRLFAMTQRSEQQENPSINDLYTVGVECSIERVLKLPDGTTSIHLRGRRRLKRITTLQELPCIRVLAEVVFDTTESPLSLEALRRAVLTQFEKCVRLNPTLAEDIYITAINISEAGTIADFIVSTLELPVAVRQHVLEASSIEQRLQKASILLSRDLDILELENHIHSQVQQEVDKTQREYFLREQLKIIQRELSEGDPNLRDTQSLRDKMFASGMPVEVQIRASKEIDRLAAMPSAAPDASMLRTYIDWLVTVPWNKATLDQLNIKEAARLLDENHFGLEKVKERILEYIAVRKLSNSTRSPILCFVGPPGVGKTSLGRSIADALGRKFVRLSLGGVRDEAEIRGHRRTYVSALPGRIVQTMKTAGTVNPLFLLDEIDKLGADFRGDPSAALLEVLDPEQNTTFADHYLEVPYDLSHVIFLTTANALHPIPPALRDRLEVIELPGYTEDEKMHIARHFLIPKQMREHGLRPAKIEIDDTAVHRLIREYTFEAGVRNLERELATIMRKVVRKVVEGRRTKTTITAEQLPDYLGPQRHYQSQAEEDDEIGVATGVAWTSAGGDLITVEATLMEGRGNLTLTGQLGDVMKESAQAAFSYTRSQREHFGIESRFYEKYDVHLHLPAGSIPKDGPSAGITMATALLSALTKRPTHRDVAMTGEITLRGRVLPVGGLKEKILAAHRAGIKTFILPKRNEKDIEDVPQEIRQNLNFVLVEHMNDVVAVALHPSPCEQEQFQRPETLEQRLRQKLADKEKVQN